MYLQCSAGDLVYLFTKLQSLNYDFKVSSSFEGLYFSIKRNTINASPRFLFVDKLFSFKKTCQACTSMQIL